MSDFKSIADAIKANFDPRLEAEAAQFRTNRDIADLKLAQAKREAERDRELDPYRQSWRELFSGGGQVPDTEYDPYHGENNGQWPVDTVARGKPVMSWNGDRGVFEFDQSRVGDIIANGTALYGPDFATKWHEFLTKAAPTYKGLSNGEVNVASRKGLEAIPGGVELSDVSEGNARRSIVAGTMANAEAKAKAEGEFGSGPDPEAPGQVIYGRRYPWLPKSMKPAGSEPPAPSSEKSANPLAELIATPGAPSSSSSEPPVPSPSPSAATTEEAKAPEDESSDPLKDQSVASILTKAVKAQVDASNKAIKAQVDSAVKNPKGRLVPIPGGGAKWVPDKIEVPDMVVPEKTALTPDELEKLSRLENPFIPRSFTEAEKKRTSDDSWKANLKQTFIDELSPEGDTQLSDQHAIALASEADNLRLKLETRGFPPESARTIAVSAVKEAFNGNYELAYQIYGKAHVVDKNEKRGWTHWDKDQLSPAEMISGAKEIKHTSGIRPSSEGKFRASIDQALGQYPIQGDPKYQKQGMDLVKTFRDYGTSTPPADVMKLASDIKFWEDIVANASNGYAAESASGRGFTQRKPSADEIEMIRRKIEAGKAKLKLKTQSN
jgi:hypothetical protein